MNIGVLILTCDKNADLAPFVNANYDRLSGAFAQTFIVTESDDSPYGNRQSVTVRDCDFATRLRRGLLNVTSDYVMILLDDHYLLDDEIVSKIVLAVSDLESNDATCISLTKNENIFTKLKRGATHTAKIFASLEKYQIDFHPTIWRRSDLLDLLGDSKMNPWEIEPLFHRYIVSNEKVALYSKRHVAFVELVYRGTFIRKPFMDYARALYNGSRRVQTRLEYYGFRTKTRLYHLTPYWIKRLAKRN